MRQNHIFSQKMVFEMAHELRKQGKTVGFTHGAFDLFHYGHLDLLRSSALACDFLIVGLESDEAIKAYKGPQRPITSQKERLEIIASNAWVDGVFIKEKEYLSDEGVLEIYQEISPDFVSYGREFAAEELLKWASSRVGAKVHKFDTVQPPQSTTDLINKIIKMHTESRSHNKNKPPVVERV